jgi:hypothetical protein
VRAAAEKPVEEEEEKRDRVINVTCANEFSTSKLALASPATFNQQNREFINSK